MFGWQSSARTRASRSSCAANGEVGAIVLLSDLERDRAPERLLDGAVDRRERAGAQLLEDAEPLDGRQRPPRRRCSRAPSARGASAPVISAGWGRPRSSSIVGATSQMRPPGAELRVRGRRRSRRGAGTGLGVCAVCGWPVAGSFISSQLPWSAVMRTAPPCARAASTIFPTPGVDRLDRVDRRVEHARVPDHVGVGEVDEHEVVLAALDRPRPTASRDGGRAHLAASGRTSRRPSATGASCGPRPRTAPRARR